MSASSPWHLLPIVALLALGLAWKVEAAGRHAEPVVDPAPMDRRLQEQGLILQGHVALSNRGPFVSSLFAWPGCDGWIAILPLHRNAEAQDLLAGYAGRAAETSFWFRGERYEDFPALRYWLHLRHLQLMTLWQGSDPGAGADPVYATAERGSCALARSIDWSGL